MSHISKVFLAYEENNGKIADDKITGVNLHISYMLSIYLAVKLLVWSFDIL